VRIPAYSPELNPAEKIWGYMKQFYKNRVFENLENVKLWLSNFVTEELSDEKILSITTIIFF
jgi:transposase